MSSVGEGFFPSKDVSNVTCACMQLLQQWEDLTAPSHEMLSAARCTARATACFTCTRLCYVGSARTTVTAAQVVRRSFADHQSQHPPCLWGSAFDNRRSFLTLKQTFAGSIVGSRIGATRTVAHALGVNPAAGQPSEGTQTSRLYQTSSA